MALTRITKGVIKPNENYDTHNIVSTGIVTAVGLDINGNADISGNFSVGGILTYEDVTSIDSVGVITARSGIDVDDFISVGSNIHLGNAGVITATSFVGDGSGLTGVASTDNIVTGTAATFTGGVDINSDLDVDGHTNLDNVSVSGISTFSGILDATNTPASIRVAQDIQHKGDANTKISFDDNRINLDTGGINRVSIADTGFVLNDELYINGNQGLPLRIVGHLGTTENIHLKNNTSGGHIQIGFRQQDSDGSHHRAYITASKGTGAISGKLDIKVRGQGGGTNRGFILDAGVGIQANQQFLPETDSIYDLGSNTLRWQNLFVDDVTATGVITATSFVGSGAQLTGIVGGKFAGGATGIHTVGNVGVQTADMTSANLVGAASSLVGLYIGDGSLLFSNNLSRSGGYYITTGVNALNAGPVSLNTTMTLDGTWVIV